MFRSLRWVYCTRFFSPGSQLSFVPRSVSIYATRTSTTANLCRSTDVSFLFLFRSILRVFNEITYRERGRRAEYSDGMTSLHIAEEKKLIKRRRKREINQTKRWRVAWWVAHEGRDEEGIFDFKTLKPFATAVGVKTGNWTRLAMWR